MAQIQKDHTRSLILETARNEFLQRGFKDASMRTIARLVGVVPSNIYNYYKDKDELLTAVLQPLLDAFDTLFAHQQSEDYLTIKVFSADTYRQMMVDEFMTIPKQFRAELKLLLFKSAGSSLEHFRNSFAERYSHETKRYLNWMKQRYPQLQIDISDFFIHAAASLWLTAIGEIAAHDNLTDDDIERFISEYVIFGTAGWKALIEI